MSLPRQTAQVVARSLATAVAVGREGVALVGSAARVPSRLVARLSRALGALDAIAVGVDAMHAEFVGMRADILLLDERVEGLNRELSRFRAEVGPPVAEVVPMRASVDALDGRLEALAHQLESVDALALRLGRITRARSKGRSRPEGLAREIVGAGELPAPVGAERSSAAGE